MLRGLNMFKFCQSVLVTQPNGHGSWVSLGSIMGLCVLNELPCLRTQKKAHLDGTYSMYSLMVIHRHYSLSNSPPVL